MRGTPDRRTTTTDAEVFYQINRRIQNIRAGKFLSTALPSTDRASMGRDQESSHGPDGGNNQVDGAQGEETSTTDRGITKIE